MATTEVAGGETWAAAHAAAKMTTTHSGKVATATKSTASESTASESMAGIGRLDGARSK